MTFPRGPKALRLYDRLGLLPRARVDLGQLWPRTSPGYGPECDFAIPLVPGEFR